MNFDGNKCKLLKMDGHGWKVLELTEISAHDWKQLERAVMAVDDWKFPEIARNVSNANKLLDMFDLA